MIDMLLIALGWLLLAVITGLIVGVFVAIREGLRRLADNRLENRRHDQLARLEGLLVEAQRMVKLLEAPPKVVVQQETGEVSPAPPEVHDAQRAIKDAVEEALRESGQLPEGWQ